MLIIFLRHCERFLRGNRACEFDEVNLTLIDEIASPQKTRLAMTGLVLYA